MADQIRVQAVEGRLLPRGAPDTGFCGYDVLGHDDESEEGDVERAQGRYRARSGGELVPNTSYYRRALREGDLVEVKDDEGDPGDEGPTNEPDVSERAEREPESTESRG